MYKFTPIFESFDQLSIKVSNVREVSLLVSYINVNQQSTQKKQHIKFRVVGKQNNIYTWKGYNFFFFFTKD